jgi:hypothetical protein
LSGASSIDRLQPHVAVSVAQTFGTPEGTQLAPELRLGYGREVLSNSRALTVATVRARDDISLYAITTIWYAPGTTAVPTVPTGLRIRFGRFASIASRGCSLSELMQ